MTAPRRVIALLATAMVLAASTLTAPNASAQTGPFCPGQSGHNTKVTARDFRPDSSGTLPRPVVLVHGWDSSYTSMQDLGTLLGSSTKLTSPVQPYLFDYGSSSSHWAAIPAIASCLADYLNSVSSAYRNAGGDGKVIGVGHSMGGLALRFATSATYAAHPVPASELAGVVTIDTPHTGSPWGNTPAAQLQQDFTQFTSHNGFTGLIPWPPGADGQTCLAEHPGLPGLPPGCATPPWLPSGVPVAQIAGDITVVRQILGVTVMSTDTLGDAVVTTPSSYGYAPASGPGPAPKGVVTSKYTVRCEITTGQLEQGLGGLLATVGTSALGLLESGLQLGDQPLTGPMPSLLALTDIYAGCGHTHIEHPAKSPQAAQAIIDAINKDNASAVGPVHPADLLSEPVPSMCGHPAGRLVNGSLPGIPDGAGDVAINMQGTPQPVFTDLNGDGITDAAVIGYCDQGGVGWPNWLLFYTGGHRLLAAFDMAKLDPHAEHVDVSSSSRTSIPYTAMERQPGK